MPAPTTVQGFLELLRKSRLADPDRLEPYVLRLKAEAGLPNRPRELASQMLKDGLLTQFQARQLLKGRWRGFVFGKYRVLEQLGSGGVSSVFLCEHTLMRRHVAIKVLPAFRAQDASTVARFYREARASSSLNHPNIARAFDVDQEGQIHYIVMEYIDGSSLHDIVRRHGQMDVLRACNYIRQAAVGLQHIHENGLVHRDIKPGNLILDRQGVVRILDLGLARFYAGEGGPDNLTAQFDKGSMLGTADYIAPEQAMDLHAADIRADIYSLGATFYFLLAGQPPFEGKSITQKLVLHQMKAPEPVTVYRSEVPSELSAIIDRMLKKKPSERFQAPAEVVKALEPWTQNPLPPPPEVEMPRLCPAAMINKPAENLLQAFNLSGSGIRLRAAAGEAAAMGGSQKATPDAVRAAKDPLADTSETFLPVANPGDTSVEHPAAADTTTRAPHAAAPPTSPTESKRHPSRRVRAARKKLVAHRGRALSPMTLLVLVVASGLLAGLGSGLLVWSVTSHAAERPALNYSTAPEE